MMDLARQTRIEPGSAVRLDDHDPASDLGLKPDQAARMLEDNVQACAGLQHRLFAEGTRALLVVLQGMDASGKDSTIRHVFGRLNPQGIGVSSFGRPTVHELARDYLWRVHKVIPRRGSVGVFNRSHYEDVLAVRVEELEPESVWSVRYDHINAFEHRLADEGTVVLKIFLHISRDEQRRKLVRRITDPKRNWKFEPSDFDARRKWRRYHAAYEDALSRCSTAHAPWHVVPADDKAVRLAAVSQLVRATLEAIDPRYPRLRIEPEDAIRLIDAID